MLVESTGARNIEYSFYYLVPDCYSSLNMFLIIVTYTMLMFVFVAIKNNPSICLTKEFPTQNEFLLLYRKYLNISFFVESTGARNIKYSLGYLAPDCYSSLNMFFMIV